MTVPQSCTTTYLSTLSVEGLRIDLDDHGVHAVRGGAARAARNIASIRGPARCRACTAPRIGLALSASAPSVTALAGNADDRNLAVGDLQILLGAFEMLGRELQDLLPHRLAPPR